MNVPLYSAWRNKNWSWIIAASCRQNLLSYCTNIRLFWVTPNWARGLHCTESWSRLVWHAHEVILGPVHTYLNIFESATFPFLTSWHGFRPHASGEFGSESGYFLNPLSREEKDKSAMNIWQRQRRRWIRWRRKIMDREIFETEKKQLRIQKYPDTCGRGLRTRGGAGGGGGLSY